ncbi:hypothetical protein FRC11_005438 [Ceratobasidium sp. 423]|nr:hypothetical protein FRC11_005438 [Ceratobasidium sp. 423]
MASQPPSKNPEKRGLHKTFLRWIKDPLKPSSNSRSLSPRSGPLTAPGLTSQLVSHSQPTGSASIPEQLPSESDGRTASPSPVPSATERGGVSTVTIGPPREQENVVRNRLSASLGLLQGATEIFSPLRSAVSALIECSDIVQGAATNSEDYELLAEEFEVLANMLNQHAGKLGWETNNGSIANIAQCIERQVAGIKQKQGRGSVGRLLDAVQDREDVVRRYQQIERLFRQLQCDISIRATSEVKEQREVDIHYSLGSAGLKQS